ncbi:type II secretion system F family protein [Blastopirellula sp. JC732]|uniref:General secretion pathway protein F n=1 Tax=Blastopirellula sediminis TaxID=2894196 RepID=A0A9X1MT48_9BACT|nr:type II secretion system F family protein [Blastopirellula sediminis]MCC9604592.1 type II secretion system F family protein [Blastopirellula sediminis]MCC9632109.1 type II secretion system F family protein [Blastopirellula sediminis]
MLSFAYSARDSLGHVHEGALEAGSPEEAAMMLHRDGMHVLSLEQEEEAGSLFPSRISRSDIIYFTNQLAVMVDTGINLSTAIESVASQEKNEALKTLLTDIRRSVEGGEDFSTALARYPKHFNRTYISLVKASEQTGMLGEMLERIAAYLRNEVEIRNKVRAALAYPAVMVVLATAVTIFLLTYVLPKFTPLFERKGAKLPTPTIIMMTASDVLLDYWWAWLIGLLAAGIGFYFFRKTEKGRQTIDSIKISVPIIGPMMRKITIARSLSTLGTLVRSDVPVLQSLELTADISQNYYYDKLWRNVIDSVTSGHQIHETLAKSKLIPPTVVQMISAGEETGRLDDVLMKVSRHYEQEVDLSIKTATSLIEPLMITVMGTVVGGIAMALLLPIFSLSRNV